MTLRTIDVGSLVHYRLSIDCRGTLVTCYRTMEHPQVPEGSSSLIQLPDELLAAVINTLTRHALGNPGDVCRLMLSCKRLRATMHALVPFWLQQCQKQGWRVTDERATQSGTVFSYYSRRMLMRWQVRSAFKQVIPFLDYTSQAALLTGATVQQLEACEQRLGITLPWQVWEMYRFRNGQDRALNIDFAYGGRLLSLKELSVERSIAITCPHEHHQGEQSVIKRTGGSHEPSETGHHQQKYDTAADPGTLGQAEDWLLPITDMFSKRRQFAVDSLGRVHLIVGFSSAYKTSSCSVFLHSLLR
ncbi:hypothetical protein WJX82_008499 [Trebouxia sp. C0006]